GSRLRRSYSRAATFGGVPTAESLRTVSETANVAPGRNGPAGFETLCSTRSGKGTVTVPVDATQLLASLPSTTTWGSSAHARSQYVPGGVPTGMTTLTTWGDAAPGARAGMARHPVKSRSVTPFCGAVAT